METEDSEQVQIKVPFLQRNLKKRKIDHSVVLTRRIKEEEGSSSSPQIKHNQTTLAQELHQQHATNSLKLPFLHRNLTYIKTIRMKQKRRKKIKMEYDTATTATSISNSNSSSDRWYLHKIQVDPTNGFQFMNTAPRDLEALECPICERFRTTTVGLVECLATI